MSSFEDLAAKSNEKLVGATIHENDYYSDDSVTLDGSVDKDATKDEDLAAKGSIEGLIDGAEEMAAKGSDEGLIEGGAEEMAAESSDEGLIVGGAEELAAALVKKKSTAKMSAPQVHEDNKIYKPKGQGDLDEDVAIDNDEIMAEGREKQ